MRALDPGRRAALVRGLGLEAVTITWNAVEAVVGIVAGIAASSVALVGFGLDSVVEASSGTILAWRLGVEHLEGDASRAEELERKASRGVAIAFGALAAYVGVRSGWTLVTGAEPGESIVGIVLAAVSLVVMPLLAWRKRRVAAELGSTALGADARQTIVCAMLSAALLVGLGANALWGWWWADPIAGLAIAAFAAREGVETWRSGDLCG